MSHPIQLSLAGDGRLVILTPQTVRKAFFQFTKVNSEYTAKEQYNLDRPLHYPLKVKKNTNKKYTESNVTITDALYRSYLGKKALYDRDLVEGSALRGHEVAQRDRINGLQYLTPQDIRKVECQINKYLLDYGLALVEEEGKLLTGYNICKQVGKNRQKVQYTIRYGMFFILETIDRQTVIKMRNVDLVFQDARTWDFHFVRYYGVLLSSLKSQIKLSFANRFDLDRQWNLTLEQFKPRQIFRIIKIYPCPDFRIL